MFVFSVISLAFGPDFAEVDYSFQIGAAIKQPAAIVEQGSLPTAEIRLSHPMATHHRDTLGLGTRQPRLYRFAPPTTQGFALDSRPAPQLVRFAAPIARMDCCLRPHSMGFIFGAQRSTFGSSLRWGSSMPMKAVSGGGGFTRSAGFQFAAPHAMGFQFGARTTVSGPWPERQLAAPRVRTLDPIGGTHVRH
jgi:hypothetical protein